MGQMSKQTAGTLLGVGMVKATPEAARRRRRPRRGSRGSAAKMFGAASLLLTALGVLAVYLG